jgi:NAD(P)-dependent dehydrogenase (short-subunit alcohol dehydrogenase family)
MRVNSIHPTGVNTPMNDGLAWLEGKTPEQIAEASAGNLLPVPGSSPGTWPRRCSTWSPTAPGTSPGTQLVLDAGLLTR